MRLYVSWCIGDDACDSCTIQVHTNFHMHKVYEFTIRTPGTPNRWQDFEHELDALFVRLQVTQLVVFRSDEERYCIFRRQCVARVDNQQRTRKFQTK
jgi:hypothetical protein